MKTIINQDDSFKLSVFRICFYITIISNLVIFIAQPFGITILISLASRCFLFSNLIAFLFVVFDNIHCYLPYKTKQIITIAFMIGFSMISYLVSSEGGLYDYIIRIWCYLALPFYFLYLDYLEPEKKMIHFIFVINILTSVVYTALSFTGLSYAGYEKYIGTQGAWLTLGYGNPNQTAMYLIINLIVLLCAFHYYNKMYCKMMLLLLMGYMGYLLIKTSSRTCIIIAGIILLIDLFKKKYRISKYFVVVILLIPVIFLAAYPYLYEHNLLNIFSFRGKSDYSSRDYIFQSSLQEVQKHFVFGKFGEFQLQNLHNGILSIYASLGLVGLTLFYQYNIRAYLNILSSKIKSKAAFISYIGLLFVFLHACTEGAFLVGGTVFAGSLSLLIYLTKLEGKEG